MNTNNNIEKSEKNIVNVHPTLAMINGGDQTFESYCLEYLANGSFTEEDAIEEITEKVAIYCLGEDFRTLYDSDLNKLSEDMLNSFKTDAQKILEEMKSNHAYIWFNEARENGIISDHVLPVVRTPYQDNNGNKGVEVFSLITGQAFKVDEFKGVVEIHNPNGTSHN